MRKLSSTCERHLYMRKLSSTCERRLYMRTLSSTCERHLCERKENRNDKRLDAPVVEGGELGQ